MAPLRTAAVLLAVLLLAACAEPSPGSAPPPSAQPPADPDALVLRVEQVGGFTTPQELAARLPVVSVHADGRVFGLGPTPAIYPALAWPNVQVRQVTAEQVQALVDRAFAAGIADRTDPGEPPLADATTTRFTLVTAGERFVRKVYALTEGASGPGLTDEQLAVRAELQSLLDELQEVAQPFDGSPEVYEPVAVAAVARPWTPPEDADPGLDFSGNPQAWPGPPLPGESIGPDVGCVVATGEQATAVRAAAGSAHVLTPWATPDGALWAVAFRPLLPDESSCADLQD